MCECSRPTQQHSTAGMQRGRHIDTDTICPCAGSLSSSSTKSRLKNQSHTLNQNTGSSANGGCISCCSSRRENIHFGPWFSLALTPFHSACACVSCRFFRSQNTEESHAGRHTYREQSAGRQHGWRRKERERKRKRKRERQGQKECATSPSAAAAVAASVEEREIERNARVMRTQI